MLHLSLQSQHLDFFRQAVENRDNRPDYQKLERDSLFLLDIFLNGMKRS